MINCYALKEISLCLVLGLSLVQLAVANDFDLDEFSRA